MRSYATVSPLFWTGETGRKIKKSGMEATIVAMHLITSPSSNMLGVYYLPIILIAHETGLTSEGASKGLRRAIDAGFCDYDSENEVVWVFEMGMHQVGALKQNDNRVKSVNKEYSMLPKCMFLHAFFEKYRDVFHLEKARGFEGAYEGVSKGHIQEQEQEQEQDRSTKNNIVENPSQSKIANRVFVHWQNRMNKPKAKLTNDRRQKINSRIREGYTEQDMIAAIDGCANSDFHMGRDPKSQGKVYDELTLILRSGSYLEKFKCIVNVEAQRQAEIDAWISNSPPPDADYIDGEYTHD